MKNVSNEIDTLENLKKNLQKQINKDCHNVEEVKELISSLEWKQKTQSSKNVNEENKRIKEIETLKASLPAATQLTQIKPKLQQLQAERKALYENLKPVKDEAQECHKEL